MNTLIYILLFGFMIYMTIQNFRKVKQNKNDSQYVEAYRKVITRSEDALDFANEYLAAETNPSLVIKTKVILLAELLEKGMDVKETLNAIDFKALFNDEKGFSEEKYNMNSDVLLWVMTSMAKANRLGRVDVIESLYTKVMEIPQLEAFMETELIKAFYNAFTGKMDLTYVNNLLNGEYGDFRYSRQTIGLVKRFAESLKAYAGEELDELSLADIPAFAETALGDYLMRDLGIYDKYAIPKEAETSYLDTLNEEEKKEEE